MRTLELNNPSVGLHGFLVIHSTELGPAFGGVRVARYPDADACLRDATRLATAMTYKCAFHDIPGGGAKVALMADRIVDRRGVMRELGRLVDSLQGEFFTGPDTGMSEDDIRELAGVTPYVSTEDVTDATARGVVHAARAAFDHLSLPLDSARVTVQGLGAVGLRIAETLLGLGAEVTGCDTDGGASERGRRAGVRVVDPTSLLGRSSDLFCPCALGGVVDETVAGAIDCRVVAGAANNVLSDDRLAEVLQRRGVTMVPDFAANGGGVIRGAWVHLRGSAGTDQEIDAIYGRVRRLLGEAADRQMAPGDLATEWVRARIKG